MPDQLFPLNVASLLLHRSTSTGEIYRGHPGCQPNHLVIMFRYSHNSTWPTHRTRAFTLVEIAVVILIIGVLTAMTLPSYRKMSLKSKATAVTKDLRTFSDAFVSNNLQNSKWATDNGAPGQVPVELANGLGAAFSKASPIGGKYLWISNTTYKAALGVTTDGADVLTSDLEQLEKIDEMLDDGNLSAGSVQMSGPMIVYVIEK